MMKFIEKIFSGLAFQIGKFLFFVLLAIAICFLVDKDKLFDIIGLHIVNAAEISYSSADYQVKKCSVLDNSCTKTNPVNFGTSESFSYQYLDVLYFNTYGNNNIIFKEGNTYTFTYIVAFNPKYDFDLYDFNKSIVYWYGNTSANNSPLNSTYISNGSLKVDNITTGDFSNYQVRFTFSFAPTTDIKYVHFIVDFPNFQCGVPDGNCPYAMNSVRVVSLNILEETGTAAAIQNQTNILINNQNQNTNEIINNQNQNTDKIVSEQEKTNEKLDQINGTLTDSDTSQNTANDFFDTSSILTRDGVVSALLTLPIQMASKLVDNLGGTCSPYQMNFGMLGKDYTLNFPCIDFEDYLGSNLWHIIDLLFCGFMAYNIAMLFVSIYDSITSLQDYYYSYIYQSSHEEHTRENRRSRTPSE